MIPILGTVAASGGGPAPPPYTASAVRFTGAVVDMILDSYAGSDTPFISYAVWLHQSSSVLALNILPFYFTANPSGVGGGNLYPNLGFDNLSCGHAWNDSIGDSAYDIDSFAPSAPIALDVWQCQMGNADINHDVGAKISQLYIGDTSQAINPARTYDIGTGGNLIVNGLGVQIPSKTNNADRDFNMAELQIWVGTFNDWSVLGNRRCIIDAGGKPVDPATAAAQFGAPTFKFSGDAAAWAAQAVAQGFAVTGSILNSSSSPSD